MENEVLILIANVRLANLKAIERFSKGDCYKLFKILKSSFKQAKAYYNSNHIITEIDDKYYDITGRVEKTNHIEFDKYYPELKQEAETWSAKPELIDFPIC